MDLFTGNNIKTSKDLETKYRAKGLDLFLWEDQSTIYLERFAAQQKGLGLGTEFMTALVSYANEVGKEIVADPDPSMGTEDDKNNPYYQARLKRLNAFYSRFGFQPDGDRIKRVVGLAVRSLWKTAVITEMYDFENLKSQVKEEIKRLFESEFLKEHLGVDGEQRYGRAMQQTFDMIDLTEINTTAQWNRFLVSLEGFLGSSVASFVGRMIFTNFASWSILDKDTITKMVEFAGGQTIIDYLAGSGYMAYLLKKAGANVIAYDVPYENSDATYTQTRRKNWFPVENKKIQDQSVDPQTVVLLSWVPYDEDIANGILKQMVVGQKLIVIGEGWGGCTADECFFHILDSDFEEVGESYNPTFSGVHDKVSMFKKKSNDYVQLPSSPPEDVAQKRASVTKTGFHYRMPNYYKFWINAETSEVEEVDVHRWFVLDNPQNFGISEQHPIVVKVRELQSIDVDYNDQDKKRDINDQIYELEGEIEEEVLETTPWTRAFVGYGERSGNNIFKTSSISNVIKCVKILESENIFTYELSYEINGDNQSLDREETERFLRSGGRSLRRAWRTAVFSPEGIGSTPNNMNIGYRGFVRNMTPDEFLSLAAPLPDPGKDTIDFFVQKYKEKQPVSNPTLYGQYNPQTNEFNVDGHEGRHRMTALKSIDPDTRVPVHVIPVGELRARHFENIDIDQIKFNPESSFSTEVKMTTAGVLANPSQDYVLLEKRNGDNLIGYLLKGEYMGESFVTFAYVNQVDPRSGIVDDQAVSKFYEKRDEIKNRKDYEAKGNFIPKEKPRSDSSEQGVMNLFDVLGNDIPTDEERSNWPMKRKRSSKKWFPKKG